MGKIFFTGDLHFGHENVLAFDHRPFSTVEEMDAELIRRWNNKVKEDDLVYVLGDMIWKSRNSDAEKIIRSLNGQKILIIGNHDRFLNNNKAKAALADIKDYADIHVRLENGTKKRVILSHYFIPMYNGHRYKAIHLHAHTHTSDEAIYEIKFSEFLNAIGCSNEIYNVGCMYWNYEPVTLDEIIAGWETVKAEFEKARQLDSFPAVQEEAAKELDELTIDVDAELAQDISAICKDAGTSIEVLTECFMRFSVNPNNRQLIEAFVKDEAAPAEADAASRMVVDVVFKMAADESLRRGASDTPQH